MVIEKRDRARVKHDLHFHLHRPIAWVRSAPALNIAIAICCAALIATIWGVIVSQSRFERQETIDNAIKHNATLAEAYEAHTVRTMQSVDATLLFLSYEHSRLGAKTDISKYILNGIIDGKLFVTITVANVRGQVILSSHPFASTNIVDREPFKAHPAADTGAMFVGKPLISRYTGKWAIPLTRRINKPDGSFGGVVSALIDPAYFTNYYAPLGAHGAVQLVGLDAITRARRDGLKASFGEDMSGSTLLREQAKAKAGSFLSAGRRAGWPRYVSYRTIAEYPLIISVGTAREEVLQTFYQNRKQDYYTAAAISVIILLLGTLLMLAVTRQKRALLALEISERLMRTTFDGAAVWIAHTALDGGFLRVNPRFCELLGYTQDELRHMNTFDVIHPESQPQHGSQGRRLIAGETPFYTDEKRFVRKGGAVIWHKRSVSLVRDDSGKPLYFIRVHEDITERRLMEAALAESDGQLRVMFEQAAMGIVRSDANGKWKLVNQKLCDMLGYSRQELLGRTYRELMHPDDLGSNLELRAKLQRGEINSFTVENRFIKKDGSFVWVNSTIGRLTALDGSFDSTIGIIEDITERKLLQEKLLHMAHHDSLTSLPNRELFYDRLGHALGQARRRKWITGVLFIDLDGFKSVNDTLGHGIGDKVLQLVASRLRQCLRGEDTVGRLGGDEFAIILSDLKREQDAGLVAQKLLDAISKPQIIEGHELLLTGSIGISLCPPYEAGIHGLIMRIRQCTMPRRSEKTSSVSIRTR